MSILHLVHLPHLHLHLPPAVSDTVFVGVTMAVIFGVAVPLVAILANMLFGVI